MKNKDAYIYGRQPVLEALESGQAMDKILLKRNSKSHSISSIVKLAKEQQVYIQEVPIEKLNRLTKKNHQGVIGITALVQNFKVEDILSQVYAEGKIPLFLVLDGVTDVRNFGAIVRSATCMGVNAIIVGSKGSAQINEEVVKASAGALWQMPICKTMRLLDAIDYLKEFGIKVFASSLQTEHTISAIDFNQPTAIVMGSEGAGVGEKIMAKTDQAFKINMPGDFDSLNVSVATGMILYEAVRQRG